MANGATDRFEALDLAAFELTDGQYVLPSDAAPDYDIRAIDEYCRQNGVAPESLSDEELRQFVSRQAA